jgi:hypothetical protein
VAAFGSTAGGSVILPNFSDIQGDRSFQTISSEKRDGQSLNFHSVGNRDKAQ